MRSRIPHKVFTTVLVVAASAYLASAASAYHSASPAARSAIVHAVLAEVGTHPCGPQPPVIRPLVSTVNGEYALADVSVSKHDLELINKHEVHTGCAIAGLPLGFFLKRPSARSNSWKIVVSLENSAQDCSEITPYVPEAVLREFHVKGIPSGQQTFGQC
jgi:hypothetical protein